MTDPRFTRTPVALALGGNQGDVARTFKRLMGRIERDPRYTILRRSDWIETDPVGGPAGQPRFLNGALTLEVKASPQELLASCQEWEAHFGRDRTDEVPDGPRPLDVDLLLFGSEVIASEGPLHLTVPHPRMRVRGFVLEPLSQIAADWVIPASQAGPQQTVAECLQAWRSASGAPQAEGSSR